MTKKLYVVTDSEAVWDCVWGIFEASSEEIVKNYLDEERGEDTDGRLVIHERHSEIIKLE